MPAATAASRDVLSVSDLAHELQQILAMELGPLRVRGEVSRFTAARSGHWYLTLKDDEAVIDCAMFRGQNRYVRVRPKVGDLVEVSGHLDLYAPRGQLSFIVRRLKMSGEGDLQQRIEALKRKLAAEGLMDPARKRPLPALPRAIGVATSPTGAAFQDILRVTGERFPSVPILLSPCRVQGREAPREVCAALRRIAEDGRADVIIVGRGGGSAEDLMAFNDERVARAIARCPTPVVSAVGHGSPHKPSVNAPASPSQSPPSTVIDMSRPEPGSATAHHSSPVGVHDTSVVMARSVIQSVSKVMTSMTGPNTSSLTMRMSLVTLSSNVGWWKYPHLEWSILPPALTTAPFATASCTNSCT